jgi:DNA helicase-2/ATP-dependent DNA helicase PcrA
VLRDPADQIAAFRVRTRTPECSEDLVDELSRLALSMDVRDVFFELMNRTRYLDRRSATMEPSEVARVAANVSRLAEAIAEFCESNPDHSLAAYMSHLDLVLLSGEDEAPAAPEGGGDAISVMTIHQAKGLEFDAVFVPSLVEGRLPQSGRSHRFELPPAVLEPLVRGREDVIAEERRLLYVAMTRARKRLYLTRAEHYEGGRRWRESRFLAEVRASGAVLERVMASNSVPTLVLPAGGEVNSDEGNSGELVLSYSSIQSYRDCPRQYWFRYRERLPAAHSAEAVQGTILHEVLRRAGEERRTGNAITPERLHAMHGDVWEVSSFPDARRAATFRRLGLAQLEAFRASGGFERTPDLVEREFSAAVDGFTLHGVIDRVDRTDEGWLIIDYKSGRPVARSRRDLQVALYALGASTALSLDPIELEVVYLAEGSAIRLEGVPKLQAEARTIAIEVAERIRAGRFEPQPERRKCRLCPYRLACAEAL